MASVVIPAHNEASVLPRCLATLLDGARAGELDVIVVANACTDSTADVARDHGVRVLETATPGKAHALRMGDEAASGYPRIYLDADVELTIDSVRTLIATVGSSGVLAASPVPRFDLSSVDRTTRRIHAVHEVLMEGRRGLAGAGVYCVNEAGHARIAPFPDVISDDGFVHRSFSDGERVVATTATSVVRPSGTFSSTLKRRIRVRQGNRQLDAMGTPTRDDRLRLSTLVGLIRTGRIGVLDGVTYLSLLCMDRVMVRWGSLWGTPVTWGSDLGSRDRVATQGP